MASDSDTGQVSITVAAKVADGSTNAPSYIFLKNPSAIDVYWGYKSTVSTTTGVILVAGASVSIPCDAGDSVYAVSSAGAATVHWARSRSVTRDG